MITVIPLAGRSQRFKDAGYKGHKALLTMPDGRPMLAHILDSTKPQYLVTAVNLQDEEVMGELLAREADQRNIGQTMVVLDKQTRGPLDTILQASNKLENGGELLINYCDCWLDNIHYFLRRARMGHDAAVATFESNDKRYQYGNYNQAIGGIIWFKDGRAFLNKARELPLNDQTGAPQVAYALDNVGEINVTGMYTDLGTPEDYEAYLSKHE